MRYQKKCPSSADKVLYKVAGSFGIENVARLALLLANPVVAEKVEEGAFRDLGDYLGMSLCTQATAFRKLYSAIWRITADKFYIDYVGLGKRCVFESRDDAFHTISAAYLALIPERYEVPADLPGASVVAAGAPFNPNLLHSEFDFEGFEQHLLPWLKQHDRTSYDLYKRAHDGVVNLDPPTPEDVRLCIKWGAFFNAVAHIFTGFRRFGAPQIKINHGNPVDQGLQFSDVARNFEPGTFFRLTQPWHKQAITEIYSDIEIFEHKTGRETQTWVYRVKTLDVFSLIGDRHEELRELPPLEVARGTVKAVAEDQATPPPHSEDTVNVSAVGAGDWEIPREAMELAERYVFPKHVNTAAVKNLPLLQRGGELGKKFMDVADVNLDGASFRKKFFDKEIVQEKPMEFWEYVTHVAKNNMYTSVATTPELRRGLICFIVGRLFSSRSQLRLLNLEGSDSRKLLQWKI